MGMRYGGMGLGWESVKEWVKERFLNPLLDLEWEWVKKFEGMGVDMVAWVLIPLPLSFLLHSLRFFVTFRQVITCYTSQAVM